MRIGAVALESPLVVAPMAGMTDTAFRRLVKKQGGCGLVVQGHGRNLSVVMDDSAGVGHLSWSVKDKQVARVQFRADPAGDDRLSLQRTSEGNLRVLQGNQAVAVVHDADPLSPRSAGVVTAGNTHQCDFDDFEVRGTS